MDTKQALYNYCLRLGDDALILGHRLSELCSRGPILEEDLALTNFSLDMIGRAAAFLKYAGEIEAKGRTEDDIAYHRSERHYYNHLLMEQPNGDFAQTIVRQLFVSAFEKLFFEELSKSKDETIAGIAAKAYKEVRYHFNHAADWAMRLGDGTNESKQRMQRAINALWMYTGELFEMNDADAVLLKQGVAVDLITIKPQWEHTIQNVFEEADLTHPNDVYMQTGGLSGLHTEHLGHILSEMQYLQRAYPDAKW